MHLIGILRGKKPFQEDWYSLMAGQMFPFPRINNETKEKENPPMWVQGVARPIQLVEYVFPKECLSEVLSSMDLPNEFNWTQSKKESVEMAILRGLIGAKKIPKWEKTERKRFMVVPGAIFHPIGIKEDVIGLDPKEHKFIQEML